MPGAYLLDAKREGFQMTKTDLTKTVICVAAVLMILGLGCTTTSGADEGEDSDQAQSTPAKVNYAVTFRFQDDDGKFLVFEEASVRVSPRDGSGYIEADLSLKNSGESLPVNLLLNLDADYHFYVSARYNNSYYYCGYPSTHEVMVTWTTPRYIGDWSIGADKKSGTGTLDLPCGPQ
jgi:hypothetical protein